MNPRALILAVAILFAQERPNFVGHWELIRAGDVPAGTIVAIDINEGGEKPRVLSVARYLETGSAELRDYLVGIQQGRVGGVSVGGGIPKEISFQSVTWEKSALLIDQEGEPGPERHERWSINDAGELVIESSDRPAKWATESVVLRYRRR